MVSFLNTAPTIAASYVCNAVVDVYKVALGEYVGLSPAPGLIILETAVEPVPTVEPTVIAVSSIVLAVPVLYKILPVYGITTAEFAVYPLLIVKVGPTPVVALPNPVAIEEVVVTRTFPLVTYRFRASGVVILAAEYVMDAGVWKPVPVVPVINVSEE